MEGDKKSRNACVFTHFPDVIVFKCCTYLSLEDHNRFRVSNKNIQTLASSPSASPEVIVLTLVCGDQNQRKEWQTDYDSDIQQFKRAAPYRMKVIVLKCSRGCQPFHIEQLMTFAHITRLAYLSLDPVTNSSIDTFPYEVLTKCLLLKGFSYSNASQPNPLDFKWSRTLVLLPELQSVDVGTASFVDCVHLPLTLTRLVIDDLRYTSRSIAVVHLFTDRLRHMTRLEMLVLGDSDRTFAQKRGEEGWCPLDDLLSDSSLLRYVELDNCRVPTRPIKAPYLKSLDCIFLAPLTASLGENESKEEQKRKSIENGSRIESTTLRLLYAPSLTHLNVSFHRFDDLITDEDVPSPVIKAISHLHSIDGLLSSSSSSTSSLLLMTSLFMDGVVSQSDLQEFSRCGIRLLPSLRALGICLQGTINLEPLAVAFCTLQELTLSGCTNVSVWPAFPKLESLVCDLSSEQCTALQSTHYPHTNISAFIK